MKKNKTTVPIWCKSIVPSGFWKNQNNRYEYMKWLGKKLEYRKPEDWYRIKQKDIKENKGYGFIHYFQDSPTLAVKEYIPNYDWKEWLFSNTPLNFWSKPENRKRYMKWLGNEIGYKKTKDWYKINTGKFYRYKGGTILESYYNGSPSAAVKEYIPNYNWKDWLFNTALQNIWDKSKNRKQYMKWLGEKLGFKKTEDWYRIKCDNFYFNKGRSLLTYYRHSPTLAIKKYIPNYDWKDWLFISAPQDFWNKRKNRHRYMEWLGKKLGYKKPEDWYGITANDFQRNKGSSILKYYKYSPSLAVMEYIPNYDWKEWLFNIVPQNFWKKSENYYHYMKWLGRKLGYKKPEDWYRITANDFMKYKGMGFLSEYYQNSPSLAVMEHIPNYDWQLEKFSYRMKTQKKLYRITKGIFQYHKVEWNYKHPDLRFKDTKRLMELDIYIPSLNLAIEYQGEQHALAVPTWGGVRALRRTQKRDQEKRISCKKLGIILIEVPHTWDGSKDEAIKIIADKFASKITEKGKRIGQIKNALKVIGTVYKK